MSIKRIIAFSNYYLFYLNKKNTHFVYKCIGGVTPVDI
jgi:hypothetical protein